MLIFDINASWSLPDLLVSELSDRDSVDVDGKLRTA